MATSHECVACALCADEFNRSVDDSIAEEMHVNGKINWELACQSMSVMFGAALRACGGSIFIPNSVLDAEVIDKPPLLEVQCDGIKVTWNE